VARMVAMVVGDMGNGCFLHNVFRRSGSWGLDLMRGQIKKYFSRDVDGILKTFCATTPFLGSPT